jgi:hypothetical protein
VTNLHNSTDKVSKRKHNKESEYANGKARLFFFDERIDTAFNTPSAYIPFDGNTSAASGKDVVKAIQQLADKLRGRFSLVTK